MAENTVSHLASIVNEDDLQFFEYQGEILFSSEEIGRQLGYRQPLKSINVLWNRNQKELKGYATGIKLMSVDGCLRETRCFTEEGVYIISMLANTPRAAEFRDRLAALLREVRENKLALAREAGYLQGKDEALSLPVMEAERKKGYLEGLKEGRNFRKERDGLVQLGRALKYRNQGLSQHEIACLLGVRQQRISELFAKARKLGMSIPQAKPTPMRRRQGNLLEVKA